MIMVEVIKNIVRKALNYLLRGNNLLIADLKAHYKGNFLQIGCSTNLKGVTIIMAGRGNLIQIGEHCSLSGVIIYMNSNNNRLIIGDNVIVNATMKSPTYFNACDGSSIKIEDNCLFSNNIEIHTTDYHKIYSDNQRYNFPKDVVIGKHTWVGLRSLIMKGVHLAPNTVVGANSVVSDSFSECNVVIAGVPAKIVKRNVGWDY